MGSEVKKPKKHDVYVLLEMPNPSEAVVEPVTDGLGNIVALTIRPIIYSADGKLNVAGCKVHVGDIVFNRGLLQFSLRTGQMCYARSKENVEPRFVANGIEAAMERQRSKNEHMTKLGRMYGTPYSLKANKQESNQPESEQSEPKENEQSSLPDQDVPGAVG